MSSRNFNVLAGLLLPAALLLTAAIYWPGLNGPFLLDDMQNIVRGHVAEFDWDSILYAVTHNTSGIGGRPVSVLSLVFSGIVHGPESWGYKYHNLLIHLLNGLLIFWLLLKLVPSMTERMSKERIALVAGVSALLWLLHPLLVSTVLYAVQRMAQLSALFTLAALLCYVFARMCMDGSRRKFLLFAYAAFPFFTLLAFLSKENGALLPLYVLAIELTVYGFKCRDDVEKRRLWTFLCVFVALPVALGSVYILTHLDRLADYSMRDFSMGERLMTQLYVVPFYLKLILLPKLSDMSLYHDDFDVVRQLDPVTLGLLSLLLLAVMLVFFLRRKAPMASFAIAWFLVSHLMESTFINLELAFEHRNYLAAAGPMFMLVYYLFRAKYSFLRYALVPVFALFVFMTVNRVQVWKSLPMIYQMAVIEHPESYRAQTEYANLAYNSGDLGVALKHLRIAQNLNRTDAGAVLHEISYRCELGENMDALLEEAGMRAARYPVSAYAMNGFDNLLGLYKKGRCPEIDLKDIKHIVQEAKAPYENRGNLQYLGYLKRIEGHLEILEGDYVAGVKSLTDAYEYTGQLLMFHELVRIQLSLGRIDDARRLIAFLERVNMESWGTETAKIEELKGLLAEAEQSAARQAPAAATGGTP